MHDEDLSWLWKLAFLKRATVGAIVSAILVYILTMPSVIDPLYESEFIVYAPLTILSQQINQQGIGFASDREIDMYIQVLKSGALTDSLIKHFEKDTNSLEKRNRLAHLLQSRIKIERTRYGSISIKVSDHDPQRAASMASSIIDLGEKIKSNLLLANRKEAYRYAQNLFEQKATELSGLEKRYDSLMRSSSLLPKDNLLKVKTRLVYKTELKELITRKNQFEQMKKDFETPLPGAYIISLAVPATKAIWPNRWLFSIASAGIFLFLLTVIEIIKRDFRS
jgi:hypothetical protein